MRIKNLISPAETFDLNFPENKPFDVVGFGLNSVDHLCVVPEYPCLDSKTEILKYAKLPGGQVATALTFLSRMGLKTKYIGKVGDDDLGQFSLGGFRPEAVDVASVVVEHDARSQYSIIIIDRKSGERTVLCQRDSRLDFRESELDKEDICAGRILHLDGYDAASLRAARWCQRNGIPVCADLDTVVPNCGELIRQIDFLLVNRSFPSQFTGITDPVESFQVLRQRYDGFLAMTLGGDGAVAWVAGQCVAFPGLKVDAVDTTGAGDIFHAGFIYGLLQNWSLRKIMDFSNAAAALSCKYLGARSGIRPLPEILQQVDCIGK
jgi:sulfofructose kinase